MDLRIRCHYYSLYMYIAILQGPNLGTQEPNIGTKGPNLGTKGSHLGNQEPLLGNQGPLLSNQGKTLETMETKEPPPISPLTVLYLAAGRCKHRFTCFHPRWGIRTNNPVILYPPRIVGEDFEGTRWDNWTMDI